MTEFTQTDGPNRNRARARRLALRMAVIGVLLVLVAIGCGRLDLNGTQQPNQKPELIFVNVPASGTTFNANPIVYWFGTDVDGRVVRYDYAVIPESTVQHFLTENGCANTGNDAESFIECANDADFNWSSIFVDSSRILLPTQEKVKLFAAFDTLECDSQLRRVVDVENDTVYFVNDPVNCISNTIPQFMFIRATDDLGANSDIKYRTYLRTNHWPETEISRDFKVESLRKPYFSLPELSPTYRGIPVTWQGSDRSDFLRDEPPLEYYWRVFGPFDYQPTIGDTLLPNGQRRTPVQESDSGDPTDGVWVADTIAYMYNLWGNADAGQSAVDTTRTARFLLVVSARDDAFVPDPSPDFAVFRAIYPKFERDVLLVTQGTWGTFSWGTPTCRPAIFYNATCDHEFLRRVGEVINEEVPGGWDFNQDWVEVDDGGATDLNDPTSGCRVGFPAPRPNCNFFGPPLDQLARHRLVIYSHEDITDPLSRFNVERTLSQYLDVGGMMWLIDRVPFMTKTSASPTAVSKKFDFSTETGFSADFGRQYFNMEGLWFPGWANGLKYYASDTYSNDEFSGATRGGDLPLLPAKLDIDPARRDSMYVSYFRTALSTQNPPQKILGIPGVPYAIRGSQSRTLYTFESWRPSQNIAQGQPVAIRFVGPDRDRPLFKTAWFGCPLYFLQEEQAMDLVRGMLNWFLVQPLEVL